MASARPDRSPAPVPSGKQPSAALTLEVGPELVEAVAERAAALVAERLEPECEPWIGVEQAAEHLAAPVSRVYALASSGRIPLERDGSRLLFKRSELDEWVRAGGARRS